MRQRAPNVAAVRGIDMRVDITVTDKRLLSTLRDPNSQ
jgi:hypothetical protein